MAQSEVFDPTEHSHRRWNPLKREWVLCSPHRTKRPWQGQTEPPDLTAQPQYDPKCYLCPGNKRAGDSRNPKYDETFRFENDFAAVRQGNVDFPDSVAPNEAGTGAVSKLYKAESARGKCYVICFSPRHDLTVAQLNQDQMLSVVTAWQAIYADIPKELPWIRYVQIFENKGSMMGCSNPHPHGQTWSLSYIPCEALKVLEGQRTYSQETKGAILLLDYAKAEIASKSPRIIVQNEHFVALSPFWAVWPFEVVICPTQRHMPNLSALSDVEKHDFASIIRRTTCRYDNLFECSFPYSMGIYQQPTASDDIYANCAQLHVSFAPPLLRSASVRKFLVGFELFGEPQRDLTAEQAAARLRDCSEEHYKAR